MLPVFATSKVFMALPISSAVDVFTEYLIDT